MKIAIVGKKNGFLERHIDELDAKYPDAIIEVFALDDADKNVAINPKLKEMRPDLLITENLERFDESTLTDGIAYNLLDCRQIHLILNEDIQNIDVYMKKQLSLAMHFFCKKEDHVQQLLKMNPDIPYVNVIPGNWTDVVEVVNGR